MAIPARKILFSEDVFKKFTTVNGAVDWNLILPQAYKAQDKWLAPYLGDALYQRILNGIPSEAVAAYVTLRDEYCVMVAIHATLMEALPYLRVKFDNGNLITRNGENTSAVSDTEMKSYIERAKNDWQYYAQRMVDYLNANVSLYSELNSNTAPNRGRRTNVYPGSTFASSSGNTAMSRQNDNCHIRQFLTNNYYP